jgi:DNA repair protein RadC
MTAGCNRIRASEPPQPVAPPRPVRRKPTGGSGGLSEHVAPFAPTRNPHEEAVIALALQILGERMREPGALFASPMMLKDYLRLAISEREHEVFAVLFLDAQHRLIEYQELFRGTLTQTSVYPREVVKLALAKNAAAVVLAHNHPSGIAEPSRADEFLTKALKSALGLIDVRVLDHIVIGGRHGVSFAERGLL